MRRLGLFLLTIGISLPALCGFVEGEQAFNQQHYSQAFSEFLPLANEGDFRSQYYVGYLYTYGYGVNQDTKEGLRYLQEAVDQNYDMAQAMMAYLYSEGQVVSKNKKKALELYKRASEQNNISANLNLGIMYYTGDGVTRDYKTALDYFKKVPVNEKPIVSRYLGSIYLNNASFRDYTQALYYYELSARQNDLSSYFNLGEIYRKGLGVSRDMTTAVNYYKYAATENYAPAQYMLGIVYANGDGVTRDIYKAYAWFKIASDQNFTNATEALEKLAKNMSLTDLEKARHQVVLVQQNEMGKMDAPLKPIEQPVAAAKNSSTSVQGSSSGVSSGGRTTRRTLRRRRR